MALYRVKQGYRHGFGKKYGPGDLVELTEQEARGFLDKLEKVDEAPKSTGAFVTNPAPPAPEPEPDAGANDETAPSGHPAETDAEPAATAPRGHPDDPEAPIGADFPGAIALARAGITHLNQVPRDEAALVAINGIGKATAEDILAALGA